MRSEPPPSLTSPTVPVCYVLERDSRADLAVLCNATERLHLPYPEKRSSNLPIEERRTYFDVGRRRRFWDATDLRRPPPHLQSLIEIDLYSGEGARAEQAIESVWPKLSGSDFFRVQMMRIEMRNLRAR